jgi:hypothetical protein
MRSLALVLWLVPALAWADDPEGLALDEVPAVPLAALAPAAPPPSEDETTRQKEADLALGLSLGASALGLMLGGEAFGIGQNADIPALRVVGSGLLIAGVVAGPSSGLAYAGQKRRAFLGGLLRAGLSAASVGLLSAGIARNQADLAGVALFGSAAFFAAGSVVSATIDIVRSGNALPAPEPAEAPDEESE